MATKAEERFFDSTSGTAKVRYLVWNNPDVETVGIYLIAHGVCEHIDRFDGLATYLADRGFVCYGEDHLGHGKTAASIADIGKLPKGADKAIVDDMYRLCGIAKEENPGKPAFLLGHSMGSFIAKMYVTKYADSVESAVFCGSGDYSDCLRFVIHPLCKVLDTLGLRDRSMLVENTMATTWWLSRDKDNRADYLKDEYITKYYTLGLMETLGLFAGDCSGLLWARKVPKDLPMLLISGSEDPVGLFTLGVNCMELWLKMTGHRDIEKKFYIPYRHEILREKKCREKAWARVYGFTMEHMPG